MDHLQELMSKIPMQNLTQTQLAYGSTVLISIAPFLILFLFRIDNTARHRNKLRLALSFASGGLLGDAFLHLIPHSMGGHHHHDHHQDQHHDHHHEHDHHDHHHHDHEKHEHDHHSHHEQTMVGLYIIAGIVMFFLIEKFVHIVKGEHHHHSHTPKKEKISDPEDSSDDEDDDVKSSKSKNTKKSKKISKQRSSTVSQTRLVSGILNLIADFLHNFTDGLAIGATFAAGHGMGAITAITILLHEIPHEIGDYAILIQAGYRRRNAIALQLVTAVGAMIGTAVGLHYGTLEHATQFILPITAGGFIYIATVSVIPELLESKTTTRQTFWEMVAMFVGIGMMYWIALNE